MPWYRAEINITHGALVCPKGAVVELGADESKSDGFVLCEAPAGTAKVAEELPAPKSHFEMVDEPRHSETAEVQGRRKHVK